MDMHYPSRSNPQGLQQVLPQLTRDQVQTLMRELKDDGKVSIPGTTQSARWFPCPLETVIAPKAI